MSDDPSADSWDPSNPQSWNTYTYALGDVINGTDPSGMETTACGEIQIDGGVFNGQTVDQVLTGTTGDDLLVQEIWHEGGTLFTHRI